MVLSFKSVKRLSIAVIGSALAAAFIGLEAKSANAALFIDQEQSSINVNMAYFSQSDLAQSFKPAANNVAGAAIKLTQGIGTVGDVKISLWNGQGNVLASGIALGQLPDAWTEVFWNPVAVTPNKTLFLVFESLSNLAIAGDTNNPYPDGQVYANRGFQSFPYYDYTFRTYSDDSFGMQSVPEPTSVLGLMTFIAFIGVSATKCKKQQSILYKG
ncbi:PEP-CTERM sorting domain-containing protein [uncultured Nostoc sp.]|uniref:PEP-CTERM sorting domain-containing protein n=1 Tax=uncultured Nostoc sp. TaxID=340711 RepID=UPI0035C9F577